MKKGCILCLLISVISLPLIAQNIIYSNLKELLAQHGDTTAVLRVEKRSRNQIVLTGGDRKSTRLNSSHASKSRMPSSA